MWENDTPDDFLTAVALKTHIYLVATTIWLPVESPSPSKHAGKHSDS